MTIAPVVRFLEDFGRAIAPGGEAPARRARAQAESGGAAAADTTDAVESARREAFGEGFAAARDELERDWSARVDAAVAETRQVAEAARAADIAALSAAVEALFGEYDAFIDRTFDTALRPLLAEALEAQALEQFKARLVEAVERKGMAVCLSGPARLTADMVALLAGQGVETVIGDDGGPDLTARLDGVTLRARLGRVEAFVAGLAAAETDGRDD